MRLNKLWNNTPACLLSAIQLDVIMLLCILYIHLFHIISFLFIFVILLAFWYYLKVNSVTLDRKRSCRGGYGMSSLIIVPLFLNYLYSNLIWKKKTVAVDLSSSFFHKFHLYLERAWTFCKVACRITCYWKNLLKNLWYASWSRTPFNRIICSLHHGLLREGIW